MVALSTALVSEEVQERTNSSEEDDVMDPLVERAGRARAANCSSRRSVSVKRGSVLPNSSFLVNEASGIVRNSSTSRSRGKGSHRPSVIRKGSFRFPSSPETSVTQDHYSDFDGELVPVRHYDM